MTKPDDPKNQNLPPGSGPLIQDNFPEGRGSEFIRYVISNYSNSDEFFPLEEIQQIVDIAVAHKVQLKKEISRKDFPLNFAKLEYMASGKLRKLKEE